MGKKVVSISYPRSGLQVVRRLGDGRPAVLGEDPIVSIPYSVELNDIAIMVGLQQESDAMYDRARDAFDQIYNESRDGARILAFGVHPYISGAAHRIKYFDQMLAYMKKRKDVVFWQGEEIYEWYRDQVPAVPAKGR